MKATLRVGLVSRRGQGQDCVGPLPSPRLLWASRPLSLCPSPALFLPLEPAQPIPLAHFLRGRGHHPGLHLVPTWKEGSGQRQARIPYTEMHRPVRWHFLVTSPSGAGGSSESKRFRDSRQEALWSPASYSSLASLQPRPARPGLLVGMEVKWEGDEGGQLRQVSSGVKLPPLNHRINT